MYVREANLNCVRLSFGTDLLADPYRESGLDPFVKSYLAVFLPNFRFADHTLTPAMP